MKYFLSVLGLVGVVLVIWFLLQEAPAPVTPQSEAAVTSLSSDNNKAEHESAAIDSDVDGLDLDAIDPAMLAEYERYQDFFSTRDHLQALFTALPSLEGDERDEALAEANAEVEKFENDDRVLPMEVLVLKLALLKFSEDTEAAKAEGEALVASYKEEYEKARAQRKPDPQFVDYKAQEKALVKEILAMDTYPDGMSRDEYLAKRLKTLRESVYTQDSSGQQ